MTDINTPTGGDKKLKSRLEGLSPEEKARLFKMLKYDREANSELFGNREAIIKDLQENYLKEDDAEVMGYKGKEVHFSLPAVGNFEGFKLDYFVSNKLVSKNNFESDPELKKKSKSMKQIGEILKAVNRYMKEMGVETDGDIDYEKDLQRWGKDEGKWGCDAGDCLKKVTGLKGNYWTSDKNVAGAKKSHVKWRCYDSGCHFDRYYLDYDYANLFLGLSD